MRDVALHENACVRQLELEPWPLVLLVSSVRQLSQRQQRSLKPSKRMLSGPVVCVDRHENAYVRQLELEPWPLVLLVSSVRLPSQRQQRSLKPSKRMLSGPVVGVGRHECGDVHQPALDLQLLPLVPLPRLESKKLREQRLTLELRG